MKKRELERRLREIGWWFMCHGGRHDQWTNGIIEESVPRHVEINESLAKKILRTAREYPPAKK